MKSKRKTAQKRATRARKSAKGARAASAKMARGLGANTGDCVNSEKWTLWPEMAAPIGAAPKGHTAIWVPNHIYDRVAAAFRKDRRTAEVKKKLLARQAGLSIEMKCEGTCDGGWCAPLLIAEGPDWKTWVCDCEYFV